MKNTIINKQVKSSIKNNRKELSEELNASTITDYLVENWNEITIEYSGIANNAIDEIEAIIDITAAIMKDTINSLSI